MSKKNTYAFICILVILCNTLVAFTKEEQQFHSDIAESDNYPYSIEAAENVICDYFAARAHFLNYGNKEALMKYIDNSLFEDLYQYSRIVGRGYCMESISIDWRSFGREAEAFVYEQVSGRIIKHRVFIVKPPQENWVVYSDGFQDLTVGFTSCSYVDDETIATVDKLNSGEITIAELDGNLRINDGYTPSTLRGVAIGELGYREKATADENYLYDKYANAGTNDYTKYGKWYNIVQMWWCEAFVKWCANEAGITNHTLIPRGPFTIQYMVISGGYYNSHGYTLKDASTYTPQCGDIFFRYDGTFYHTGIVCYTSGDNIIYISGNAGNNEDRVQYDTRSKTDTAFIGFVHPCDIGHRNEYAFNSTGHWLKCKVCEQNGSVSSHNWMNCGSYYHCPTCGADATTIIVP